MWLAHADFFPFLSFPFIFTFEPFILCVKCYGVNQEAYVLSLVLRHGARFTRDRWMVRRIAIYLCHKNVYVSASFILQLDIIDLKLRKIKVDMDSSIAPQQQWGMELKAAVHFLDDINIRRKRRYFAATGIRTFCNNNNYIKCHIDL